MSYKAPSGVTDQVASLLPSKYRRPPEGWRLVTILFPTLIIALVCVTTFGWRPFGFVLVDVSYYYLLLAAFLPLCFIWTPAGRKVRPNSMPFYDVALALLGFGIPLYFVYHVTELLAGWEVGAPPVPMALAFILWLVVLEAGRRAGGMVFASVVAFFSFYPLFAPYMPGIMSAPAISFRRLTSFHAMGLDSMIGIPLRAFSSLMIGYMVFAVVVQMVGAGKLFNDIAASLVGSTRAVNSKVSAISSGLFGSISGASIANVFVTGTFTIPAMKREGLSPEKAAAVEAVASTGGILMPPVMGATAFVMSEFMGVPYARIALAAIIPSLLYYVTIFAHIDAHAARIGMKPLVSKAEGPPIWHTLVNNLHILLALLVLIVLIFYLRLESQAPWIASLVAIGLGMLRKQTRLTPKSFITLIEDTGRILSELAAILTPVGLIIGSFVITGLAFAFPYLIVGAAQGNLYLILVLGAFAAFILGMGVPLVAVYIFMAIIIAPALVLLGLNQMATHLYILYWGMMACITPPVAITVFAAASLADANPMKTGFEAIRLAAAIYILPLVFVLNPALILQGAAPEIIIAFSSTLIGFVILSGVIEGYMWKIGELTVLGRLLFLTAGLGLSWPGRSSDLYGLALLVLLFSLFYLLKNRRSPILRLLVKKGLMPPG